MRFKDLKLYLSHTEKISICFKETMGYENYFCLRDIPDVYDDLYVFGIGMIQSEFEIDKELNHKKAMERRVTDKYFLDYCIEIVLSKAPREDVKENEKC